MQLQDLLNQALKLGYTHTHDVVRVAKPQEFLRMLADGELPMENTSIQQFLDQGCPYGPALKRADMETLHKYLDVGDIAFYHFVQQHYVVQLWCNGLSSLSVAAWSSLVGLRLPFGGLSFCPREIHLPFLFFSIYSPSDKQRRPSGYHPRAERRKDSSE